ncbi:MAG: hypothetical protein K6G33_04355 [Ruminococcus sp.]|uniref:hypothetical protein n=1 Tax=Ruminococcus sp. TaxID=41978 RepID=UPI0025D22AFE|nr:hypothetical protein [Ruminococcus sp.]MCR5599958.1 hypothetical protein [Ruminococcus sp.]
MKNEELTRKIKRLSNFSLVAIIIYFVLNILGFFTVNKSYIIDFDDHSMPENIIGIISMLTVVFCAVAGAITTFMMLNDLSKKRTPFTLRISCLMRNLGIYLIILDIAKAIFVYIAAGEVIVGLFWFAGIIFYAFSLVFRYGKNLQKESDETL